MAAAKAEGVWRDGHTADGGPEWGDEDQPSPECFEFAVCFDAYCMEVGVDRAVVAVREALGIAPTRHNLAA